MALKLINELISLKIDKKYIISFQIVPTFRLSSICIKLYPYPHQRRAIENYKEA